MGSKTSAKDALFETAARLFYQYGYRATGVDRIAAESGIGKMTLYRHYPAKDDLIVAYLHDSDREFWDHFERNTQAAPTARGKLLAFFASLQEYVTSPACYGCAFLNVAAEYPEGDYPGHRVALEHKQAVRERFRTLAAEAGARQPEAAADALFLLLDGAYLAARMFGPAPNSPAHHLTEAARAILDAQCSDPSPGFGVPLEGRSP